MNESTPRWQCPPCPQITEHDKANQLYEAIGSDGMIPYSKEDASWLLAYVLRHSPLVSQAAQERPPCNK